MLTNECGSFNETALCKSKEFLHAIEELMNELKNDLDSANTSKQIHATIVLSAIHAFIHEENGLQYSYNIVKKNLIENIERFRKLN